MFEHTSRLLLNENDRGSVGNITRIAKAASHKLPGKSSFNVNFVCPVCRRGPVKTAEMVPCGIYYSDTIDYS